MKILYLIREDFNEIVSLAYYELVQELKSKGHEITVANLSGKFLDFPCIKINQFKFIDYPFGFVNRFFFGKAVSEQVNPKKFDLVLSSMAETLFFLSKWNILKTAVIHDNFFERAKFTPWFGKQFKLALKVDSFFQEKAMKKADGLIFLNKNELNRMKNKTKAKCIVIHNGVNPQNFFSEEKEINKIKSKYPKKIVLFLARIELQKNPLLFVKAAEKLQKENAVFLIGGKGPMEKKLIKLIKEKNLLNTKFLGWIKGKEKNALINSCEIYVLPSFFEPVSVSTLEAMACKKPVIVSDVGGLKEIVDDFVGIKFESNNSEDLAEKIKFLLDNPKKAQELGLNGFKKIKSEFLWENIAEKYINFFGELLNERK